MQALIALAILVSPILGASLRQPILKPALLTGHRIIGGSSASISTYPFQGSLQRGTSHSCGVAKISNTWAVTAAHCLGSSPSTYRLRFGSSQWGSGGTLVYPNLINIHENYGSGAGSFPNDIAVMRFPSSSAGASISMASDGSEHGGQKGWISGWGVTSVGGGGLPSTLQHADINIYTNSQCQGSWGSSINSGHVCIGDTSQGHGSCNGDSGGPLVTSSRGTLVGITSWGISGCSPSYPSVYSRIAFFRSWIRGKTGV
jgi:elastase-2